MKSGYSHLKYTLTGLAWFALFMLSMMGADGLARFLQVMPGALLATLPLAWWLGKYILTRLEDRRGRHVQTHS